MIKSNVGWGKFNHRHLYFLFFLLCNLIKFCSKDTRILFFLNYEKKKWQKFVDGNFICHLKDGYLLCSEFFVLLLWHRAQLTAARSPCTRAMKEKKIYCFFRTSLRHTPRAPGGKRILPRFKARLFFKL